jgi:hypothetical protein
MDLLYFYLPLAYFGGHARSDFLTWHYPSSTISNRTPPITEYVVFHHFHQCFLPFHHRQPLAINLPQLLLQIFYPLDLLLLATIQTRWAAY